MTKRYQYYDCDDPYKMLAVNIISSYGLEEAKEMIGDPELIILEAKRETPDCIDIYGDFGDCAVDMMMSGNGNAWSDLAGLITDTIISNLDIPRIQKELSNILRELDL